MEAVTPRQDLLSNIGTRISWIKVKNRVSINKTRSMVEHLLSQTVVFRENKNDFGQYFDFILGQFKRSFNDCFPIFHPQYQKCLQLTRSLAAACNIRNHPWNQLANACSQPASQLSTCISFFLFFTTSFTQWTYITRIRLWQIPSSTVENELAASQLAS